MFEKRTTVKGYKDLDVWKASIDLVNEIYSLTKAFPANETYGLSSQMKRASVSISANIAEGLGRQNKKDTIHFFHISRGSLYELDTLLHICFLNNFLVKEVFERIIMKIERVVQLVNGFIKYLRTQQTLR